MLQRQGVAETLFFPFSPCPCHSLPEEEEDNGLTEHRRIITHSLSLSPEMATPATGREPRRDDSERPEPNHPEPACQEAQKWIEVSSRRGSEDGVLVLLMVVVVGGGGPPPHRNGAAL